MFGLWFPPGNGGSGPAHGGLPARPVGCLWGRTILRLGLIVAPLTAGLPGGASAQALGTMQVTARVLPGGAAWLGLAEAQALGRQVLLSPAPGPHLSRNDLVRTRAEFASTGGRRRLLVTVDYPRN
jgi:hypothetical protein